MVAIFLVMLASRGRAHSFARHSDPRVGIPIGEEAGRSKGSPSFPDTCLITESGPTITFKTRHLGDLETIVTRDPQAMECQNLPGFGLSSEGPAVAVHFGRLEDRNAPRMGSRGHQPSHIQRHPCYPTTIGVSGNLS